MSPLADGALVIAHMGGMNKGALTAFDAATGKMRWQWTGDGPAYASPVVATIGGTRHVITQTQKSIVGVNAADGALRGKRRLPRPTNRTPSRPWSAAIC